MSLVVMGASYKSAPIDVRERIAVDAAELAETLQGFTGDETVREVLVLSTCNRVEVLLDAKTDRMGAAACTRFFQQRAGQCYSPELFYLHRGPQAVRHLLRVVCSLDSQILGEAQILGQVRRAYSDAVEAGTCGEVLTKLCKTALELGKRARSETGIGSDSVSLSTTAFKAALSEFEDISQCRTLLIGSGEMARLTGVYLDGAHVEDVTVVSRTIEHAQETAREFGAVARPMEDMYPLIAASDLVFAMTSSQDLLVEAQRLQEERAAAGRERCKLVIIDESVPRNVASACAQLENVVLYDQERLTSIVDDGLASRMQAVAAVERMVDAAQDEFLNWMQERLVIPTIKGIYEKGDIVLSDELIRARKGMENELGREVTDEELHVLAAYGNAIVKKMLHGPVMRLRKEATSPDSYYYTGAARYLFGLDVFPPGMRKPCQDQPCLQGKPCPIGLDEPLQPFCRESWTASS